MKNKIKQNQLNENPILLKDILVYITGILCAIVVFVIYITWCVNNTAMAQKEILKQQLINYNNGVCLECSGHYNIITVKNKNIFLQCDNCQQMIKIHYDAYKEEV